MLGMQDVGSVQKLHKPNSVTAFFGLDIISIGCVSKPREYLH